MFGVAEDHVSNPIKIGLGRLKERGAKVIAVNPARTGYAAIADEWLGIRPGTDGLFVLSLVHTLLRTGKIDLDYLMKHTNAGWLVIQTPGLEHDGLFARDDSGTPLMWDRVQNRALPHDEAKVQPALTSSHTVNGHSVVPVFQLIAERYTVSTYAPDAVADKCGIEASTIERIAAEIADAAFNHPVELPIGWTDSAGVRHETMTGRPRWPYTPCAVSQLTPTAFRPAALCTFCRC